MDRLPGPAAQLNGYPMTFALTCWPEIPSSPGQGAVAVIRVISPASRSTLREIARACVLTIVRSWGFASASLSEEAIGPRLVDCDEIALSLSYTNHCAWIAIARGRSVGIDATAIRNFGELDDVARIFLGPSATNITSANDPAAAFAAAWTKHEATLKYHRLPLTEWHTGMPAPPRHLSMHCESFAVSVVLDR